RNPVSQSSAAGGAFSEHWDRPPHQLPICWWVYAVSRWESTKKASVSTAVSTHDKLHCTLCYCSFRRECKVRREGRSESHTTGHWTPKRHDPQCLRLTEVCEPLLRALPAVKVA
ncbi:unnamed protein product, partial [Ectocarpus sp. 12 AP-2014]